MAYQAWSVVFGEQPTAAKWNILGTNDESFHDGTGIDDRRDFFFHGSGEHDRCQSGCVAQHARFIGGVRGVL